MVTRRRVLASSSIVATTGLAGCSEVRTLLGGPDPKVVDASSGHSENVPFVETLDVYVLVENQGGTGDVRVELRTLAENGNVLNRFEQTVEIREGARRRVKFQIDVLSSAERIDASAEAT